MTLSLVAGSAGAESQPDDPLTNAYLQMMQHPSNPDLALNYARLAAANGQTRAAINALERVLRQNPRLDNIRLELASLYLASGSPDVAAIYAREALASPNIPPDVAAPARDLLAQAEKTSSRSLLDITLFAGARHDSDANQATSLTTVSVFAPGLGIVPVSNSVSAEPSWSSVLSGQLYHRYDLGLQTDAAWETNGSVFDQRFASINHNYDLFLTQVDTGPRFGVGTIGEGAVSIRPFMAANYLAYGSSVYAWLYGGGLAAEYRLPPRWEAGLQAIGYQDEYYNTTFRPTSTGFTGPEFSIIGSLKYTFSPNTALSGSLYYYDASARENFNSRSGPGASILLASGVTVRGYNIGTTARLGMRYLAYGAPDPSIDPTQSRNDPIFEAGASLSFPLTAKISLVLQYDYVRDNSSYSLYRFTNNAVTFGLQLGL